MKLTELEIKLLKEITKDNFFEQGVDSQIW
jgi:hypothetical protein